MDEKKNRTKLLKEKNTWKWSVRSWYDTTIEFGKASSTTEHEVTAGFIKHTVEKASYGLIPHVSSCEDSHSREGK